MLKSIAFEFFAAGKSKFGAAVLAAAALCYLSGSSWAESPALTAARAAAAKAEADADKARDATIISAKKKLLEAVSAALKEAMAANDLPSANSLDAEKKRLEAVIAALAAGGTSMKATIAATKGWQPVGKVKAGQVIEVTASGTWKMGQSERFKFVGAEGAKDRDTGRGRLVARVGDQIWYPAENKRATIQKDGVLEMRPEDLDSGLLDNTGALAVEVATVIPDANAPAEIAPASKPGELFNNSK